MQNILVKKLEEMKILHKLAKDIIDRPKYSINNKTFIKTGELSRIKDGDIKFIASVLHTSNPLYYLTFKKDSINFKPIGINIETDFNSSLISEIYDTMTKEYWDGLRDKQDIELLEIITKYINSCFLEFLKDKDYMKEIFMDNNDIRMYSIRVILELNLYIQSIQKINIYNKKLILRILKSNLELSNTLNRLEIE